MSHELFDKHLEMFRKAMAAVENRVFWSPFPEDPVAYGEGAVEEGMQAFEAYRDASFYLDQPGVVGRAGSEVSPFGLPLNVSYPVCNPDALLLAGRNAMSTWVKAGPDVRVGVCLELLSRLKGHGMEIAFAAMHTTGQPFPLAFQFSFANALDRGLEATVCAYREMKQVPSSTVWEKPQGGGKPPLRLEKRYTVLPRGASLVVAGATSPTWNSFPAIFASLATGNPVIVKPHSAAILPLAITVAVARMTLKEAGFDPNLVSLLVDDETGSVAKILALNTEVRIIDYTGHAGFGEWLEENARHAAVFAQKAGLNAAVVDSTDDYRGLLRNLTLSLCLYSGQLAGTPRVILVSREGIRTPDRVVSSEQFGHDLSAAMSQLLEDPKRAGEILGTVQSDTILAAVEAMGNGLDVLREARSLSLDQWPEARVRTPLLLQLPAADIHLVAPEAFGPIAYVMQAATTAESLAVAERLMVDHGALTFLVHTTNSHVQELAGDVSLRAGVPLSFNLTGNVLVNRPAAYSDFHGAGGANCAADCSFVDSAFVTRRFCFIQTQHQRGVS